MSEKILTSLSLIVPVYNERDLIIPAVERYLKVLSNDFVDFEIIFVDDGSTDGSDKIIDELAEKNGHIKVLHNLINLNLGITIQRGMMVATKEFVIFDGIDLCLAPEDFAEIVSSLNDCDMLILERRSYPGCGVWRRITSMFNRLLLRILFGSRIRDMNFTFIYRRDITSKILPLAKSPTFTHPEMILRAEHIGLRVKSIKVDYHPRTSGKGAFGKSHDILWTLYDMLRFRLKMWSGAIEKKG